MSRHPARRSTANQAKPRLLPHGQDHALLRGDDPSLLPPRYRTSSGTWRKHIGRSVSMAYLRGRAEDDFDWSTISTSLFGNVAYLRVCVLPPGQRRHRPSAGTQIPFFFLGTGVLVAASSFCRTTSRDILHRVHHPRVHRSQSRSQSAAISPRDWL